LAYREIRGLRYRAVFLLVLVFSSTLLSGYSLGLEQVRFRLTDTYVLENRGNESISLSDMDRAVSLFQNNSWQTVRILEANPSIERLLNDSDGNLYAVLAAPDSLEGRTNLTMTVVYEIASMSRSSPALNMNIAQNLSQIPKDLVSEYCAPGGTWLTGDPEIREKAEDLAGDNMNVLMIVENLIYWIGSNINYSIAELPRYPNETLAERSGDCDDQSILLITMCRILGIPAYLQVGCVLREDIKDDESVWSGHVMFHEDGVGWHGWSMVYIPPWGWLPVDLTYVTALTGLVPEIQHAGIYEDYIILEQNVSNYDYVGESRSSREEIINSDLYIYLDETMVQLPAPTPPIPWIVIIPVLFGSLVILVLLYSRRVWARRQSFYF
jgi:transglutaminase-like putative cysteine protease